MPLFDRTRNKGMALYDLFSVYLLNLVLNPLTVPPINFIDSLQCLRCLPCLLKHESLAVGMLRALFCSFNIFIIQISLQASLPQGSLPSLSTLDQVTLLNSSIVHCTFFFIALIIVTRVCVSVMFATIILRNNHHQSSMQQ